MVSLNYVQFFKYYQKNYLSRGSKQKITSKHQFNNIQWHNCFLYRKMNLCNKLPSKIVACEKVETKNILFKENLVAKTHNQQKWKQNNLNNYYFKTKIDVLPIVLLIVFMCNAFPLNLMSHFNSVANTYFFFCTVLFYWQLLIINLKFYL